MTLVKIDISFRIINRGKNTFELVDAVLKVPSNALGPLKRIHGSKFQSVTLPNGLIANTYGPVGKSRHKKAKYLCPIGDSFLQEVAVLSFFT